MSITITEGERTLLVSSQDPLTINQGFFYNKITQKCSLIHWIIMSFALSPSLNNPYFAVQKES